VRRIVVTVCPRERGTVRLPVERRGRERRVNAPAILRELRALVARRGLAEHVTVRDGCAGGCALRGPNVTVTIYPPVRAGERPDQVAVGWKSYVGSLGSLDCLARVVEDGLRA
jgi:hypothetical protein